MSRAKYPDPNSIYTWLETQVLGDLRQWLVWVRRHETHPSSPPKLEFQARCRYCWGPDTLRDESRGDVPRLAIVNTGAMRFDIFKGPFTEDSAFIDLSFKPGVDTVGVRILGPRHP
jgi:hypothetical protein